MKLSLAGTFIAVAVTIVLVYGSFMLYSEAECLRNGYPKYAVTIGLERYCLTLDGSVTVKVNKIK